ncbi:MAG TPA: cupin domain-containing protein [Solirubrobacteraceae bacterium]|nr:cupin domain-containing protein [Solirubrobacteraceae bacterium]
MTTREQGGLLTTPDGTTFTVVESGADNGGERITFEITMAARSPGPPRHVHPEQVESWEVLDGELSLLVADEWRTLAAGETLTIPPGTVHTLRNRSEAPVRLLDIHEPALDFQDYIEDLDRLTRTGKLRAKRSLGGAIHGAMVLVAHRPMQITADRKMRIAETVLARTGRLLGRRQARRLHRI